MELTFHTDYALRVLTYLGLRPGRLCLIADIAEHYRISRNHLVKVVHRLARGGFVRTYRGKGGGVTLARAPGEINVGAVVRCTEGPVRLVECFRGEDNTCVISGACMLAGMLQEACENFLVTLDRYTLADLLTRRARLSRMLALPPLSEEPRRELPRHSTG
ncbi:MAG: RrF2 family transcriptional regulator [Candidatus Binataceae bacterium]